MPAIVLALTFTLVPVLARASAWTNEAGTSDWSTPDNWTNGVPCSPGDGIAQFLANNAPNAVFGPCTLNRLEFANTGFNVGGSGPIIMSGAGATIQSEFSTIVGAPVTFAASTVVHSAGSLLTLNGSISGAGAITVTGTGGASEVSFVTFDNSSGAVTVNAGAKLSTGGPSAGNNALTIDAGGTVDSTLMGQSNWGSLSGAGALVAGPLIVGNLGSSVFSGSLSVGGTLTKGGTGTLQLTGTNTISNVLIPSNPGSILHFGDGTTGTFPAGANVANDAALVINLAGTANIGSLTGSGNLVVASGTANQVDPNWNYSGNTTISGGNLVTTSLTSGGSVTLDGGTWTTGSGSIGSLAGNGTVTLNGSIDIGTDGTDSTYSGLFVDGGGRFQKVGAGTLTLSAPNLLQMGVALNVLGGTLKLQGTSVQPVIVVGSGATLAGSGTISGAQFAPGSTFAPLDLRTFSIDGASSTWSFVIDGTSPGIQHGQVRANQVSLGAVLNLTGSHVPTLGETFMIVQKIDLGLLTGTFQGLPQGAVITFNGVPLRITYTGFNGNDVVLSVATQQVTPSATGNGGIDPVGVQTVVHGATTQFSLFPAPNHNVASVTGTCGGSLGAGNVYTTNAVTADCTVIANFAPIQHQVTPSASGNGTISPNTAQAVDHGATRQFTVTPNANHSVAMGGTCPAGSLVGTTYTTGSIIAACTVVATFTPFSYLVTPVTALNGTIAPLAPQTIDHGMSATFTITPNVGYSATIEGTCPAGSLNGTQYTTGPITAACTVIPTFAVAQYTVTPSAGAGGSISPSSAQLVNHNATPAFTITADPGYAVTMGGTCGGNLVGTTYTTNPVTANCTVSATFALVNVYNVVLEGYQQVGPYVETAATGGGTVQFNTVTKKLKLNLTYTGAFPNAAHIHGPALRGANAPVLITLSTDIPLALSDEVTLDAVQEAMLLAGQLYVNLHSINYPNGQLRGQIDNLGARVLYTLTGTAPAGGIIQGGTEAGNNLFHCPPTCSMPVPEGSAVELVGISDTAGYSPEWGGACTGTPTGDFCEFTMDADKTVSATFISIGTDLSATLTAAPNPAAVGQNVTFTLTLSNAGPGANAEAAIDMMVPAGLSFVSAGAGCTHFPATPDHGEGVYCEAPNLAENASRQYTVVLRPTATGTIPVMASAYSGSDPDYDASNNDPTVDLVVNPGARLGNISTRMQVLTGNDVLIGGFVIGGSTTKRVAIVATGPSLAAFGITNALANPTLRLVRSSDQATIATNDDWQTASNAADLTAAGFAPSNALEAAILVDLAPGAYTAIVEGAGGATGVSVIGVYEVNHPEAPLINISTRGRVLTGNDVMIGGFVVNGAAPKTLAIVATGPSLAAFGITSPLADPMITVVRSSDQAVVASNDNWQADANSAQLQAKGFAPSNPLEAGLLLTLPAGAYTVIVQGVGGGTGVAVIGAYAVD